MSPAELWPPRSPAPSGPLAGVRVLDLSAFAVGPWAGSLLAALGADVLKIDPPYGDHIRNVQPSRSGEATTYTVCNLGKRSLELDLKDAAQREFAHRLAAECDVVLENSREGAMDRLGMGYDTLRALNPRLVYCASSSFGSVGPLATVGSTDPQGQAFSGFVSIQGDERGSPEFLRYVAVVDLGTSACLVQAVLAGLHRRERTGVGCVVKTSQLEGALALQASRFAEQLVAGVTPRPLGSASAAFAPSGAFGCRDGQYLMVSTPEQASWRRLCAAIRRPGLVEDSRFATNSDRVANRGELAQVLAGVFAEADTAWWRGRLGEHRVAHAVPLVLDELMRGTGPRLTESFLTELAHPVRGRLRAVRPPWSFERTPARFTEAPVPGQHNDEFTRGQSGQRVSGRKGAGAPDPAVPAADVDGPAAAPTPAALAGVRVLELTQGIAGPYCGLLLRALGAEVTKLEPPEGDYARQWAPADPVTGDSAAFRALNRGKRGLRLAGPHVGEYQEPADVLLVDAHAEGFDPGELDRFVDDQLAGGALVCRLSPVGDGPDAQEWAEATELEVQALAGLTRYLGALGGPPVRVGADLAMTLCGAFAAQGVLAGLLERRSSGRGQLVEVSALGSLMSVMCVMVAALDDPDEWTGFHLLAAGYPRDRGVRTADGAISFSAPRGGDEAWSALCHELGAGPLAADERYLGDARRTPRSKELNEELARYTARLSTQTVLEATYRHGGLGAPVQTYPEVLAHPQVAAMDVRDTAGGYPSLAAPWRIDGARPHIPAAAPALGEHNPAPGPQTAAGDTPAPAGATP